ncbi:N-acetylglucosamine kinase [Glaciibacter sp. 2TAF33]|uniref:N-acetylglucosamine kinase n=1 Tax=Glaciibacter sp. 2TAF33 TaxID=3233015 RepID=UPI003F926493
MSGLLAIDAGGTTTRAVIIEPSGHCRGLGFATSGNPTSGGSAAAIAALVSATERALVTAGAVAGDFSSATIAMAGAGTRAPIEQIRARLAPLGLLGPVEVVSDLLATFCSGTLLSEGYVVVAGTGAGAARIEDGRIAAVADGLGWLLGDAGSGYWIGHRVASAVVGFLDGRAPQTALTGLLVAALDLEPAPTQRGERPVLLAQLVDALYALRPVELSRFAPLAFQAHDDDVARGILADAASELSATLASVRSPGVDGPLVLGGSVANSGLLSAGLPGNRSAVAVPDGVVGAAVLGLRRSGIRCDDEVFRRLTDDVGALRDAARSNLAGER